jgi:alanine dehydrogenase
MEEGATYLRSFSCKSGVPKEIKKQEHRVGMVPASVREMVAHGHKVLVETGAGAGIGFDDAAYQASGAEIAGTPAEIFAKADMIVKVKEPQASECAMLRPDQILFTYLHLAADRAQAEGLIKSGAVAIAYETVTGPDGRGLPLLAPMSEIAGRLSVQVGGAFPAETFGRAWPFNRRGSWGSFGQCCCSGRRCCGVQRSAYGGGDGS